MFRYFCVCSLVLSASIFTAAQEATVLDGTDAVVSDQDSSVSRFAKDGVLNVEKLNGLGSTEIVWNKEIPVRKNLRYKVKLELIITEASSGSAADLQFAVCDSMGNVIKWNKPEKFAKNQIPLISSKGEYREVEGIIETDKNSEFIRVKYILAGNPVKVGIKKLSVFAEPEPPKSKPIADPKDKLTRPKENLIEALRKVKPYSVKVEKRNETPSLIIDGSETPFVAHASSYHFKPAVNAGIHIHISLNYGQNLYSKTAWWDPPLYKGNDIFDFSRLEENILRIYDSDPEAKVIVGIRCDPDPEWIAAHPESCFRAKKGGPRSIVNNCHVDRSGEDIKDTEVFAHTYASEEYQEHIKKGLRALGKFLKESPAGNVVIGFFITGGKDGQFCPWLYGKSPIDYSESNLRAFRNWLREKYSTDEELKKAWGNQNISFSNADFYSEDEWTKKIVFSSEKGPDRRIADAREFQSVSTARMLRGFSAELKKSFGRASVGMVYYSSAIWTQMTRLALDELVANEDINAVAMVTNYLPYRQLGWVGGSGNFCIGSTRLRNVMYIQELDHRTWRSYDRTAPMICAAQTPDDYRNQILRDVGAVLAGGGSGFYFLDMGGSAFNAPACTEIFAETVKIAGHSMKANAPSASQVAFFLDERLRFYCDLGTGDATQSFWKTSGITPDIYHLADICRNDLPDYRMYVFFSPVTADKNIIDAIRKKAMKDGKVCIVTGRASSAVNPQGPELFLKLLGMHAKKGKGSMKDLIVSEKGADSLLKNLPPRIGLSGLIDDGMLKLSSSGDWYYINDPASITLGKWNGNDLPAVSAIREKNYTLIYSALDTGICPELLHNAAVAAGVKPFAPVGNVTAVGHGVAALHRITGNPAVIEMSVPSIFRNIKGEFVADGMRVEIPMKLRETKVLLYDYK